MTALLEARGVDRHTGADARAIVHQSDRSLVYRCYVPNLGRVVVHKQPRGPVAAARLLHERRTLERLAGIEGVPALADAATDDTLAFEDDGGLPLHPLHAGRRVTPAEVAAIGQGLARISPRSIGWACCTRTSIRATSCCEARQAGRY
ncbi:MAG TPA: hypothetical protein VFE41_19405 [Acetobacteraceae bacterium]|nr:hypothetical protein [Acetobacteraceae bacterium]